MPAEVQPLVEEVNALLDGQEREIERSRGRAVDLAHGLKTPLAALAADARRLREHGQDAIARDIDSAVEAMSRHVDRELARARVRGTSRRKADLSTTLAPLLRALTATLAQPRIRGASHLSGSADMRSFRAIGCGRIAGKPGALLPRPRHPFGPRFAAGYSAWARRCSVSPRGSSKVITRVSVSSWRVRRFFALVAIGMWWMTQ